MRYLRKRDEDKLHIWTPELAKRDDMIEVVLGEVTTASLQMELVPAAPAVEIITPEPVKAIKPPTKARIIE